jgi:hypothetical protein
MNCFFLLNQKFERKSFEKTGKNFVGLWRIQCVGRWGYEFAFNRNQRRTGWCKFNKPRAIILHVY